MEHRDDSECPVTLTWAQPRIRIPVLRKPIAPTCYSRAGYKNKSLKYDDLVQYMLSMSSTYRNTPTIDNVYAIPHAILRGINTQ